MVPYMNNNNLKDSTNEQTLHQFRTPDKYRHKFLTSILRCTMLFVFLLSLSGCGADQDNISNTIVSSVSCLKIDLSLTFEYRSAIYSSGERFVSCAISNSEMNSSNTFIYKPTQNKAITGYCAVIFDINAPTTSKSWVFTSQNNVTKAVYSHDSTTVTFVGSECEFF